jgi:hypothetical protein
VTVWILTALLACGTSTPVADPAPAAVAAVAEALEAAPGDADAILSEHGWTAETFEARMYEIAEDPALTKAFLDAR